MLPSDSRSQQLGEVAVQPRGLGNTQYCLEIASRLRLKFTLDRAKESPMFQFSAKIFWSVLAALFLFEIVKGLLFGGLLIAAEMVPWDAFFS